MCDQRLPESVHVAVHWSMRLVSVILVVLSSYLAIDAWRGGDFVSSAQLGVFVLLGLWVFFLAGSTIDADGQRIRITTPHGAYEMLWSEMKSFETNGSRTYLLGEDKALAYSLALVGKGKREFREVVAATLRDRGIPACQLGDLRGRRLTQMKRNAKVRGWKLF